MFTIKGKYTTAKVMIDHIDDGCCQQIESFVNHSAFTNPVAIMPDTHAGKGSVIGFTMEMTKKIIPNVIGVDIGCGMRAINVGKELPLSLEKFDHKVRQRVPFGQDTHENAVIHMKNDFPWHETQVTAEKFAAAYADKYGIKLTPPKYDERWFLEKCRSLGGNVRRYINSVGTLGGGNHFIETGVSSVNDDIWVTVHSGSRNFGKKVCEYWQGKAAKIVNKELKLRLKEGTKEIKALYSGEDISKHLDELKETLGFGGFDHKDKEWLEGELGASYLFDMIFAQAYAQSNRKYMINAISSVLKIDPSDMIETVHNYIDFEDMIIRKGAVRSYEDERIIIPFNMRDGILICEGKSNEEWNYSAPHGAGRVLSRTQARKTLELEKFKQQMEGIYSTSVCNGTLDESPDAYKSADVIEKAIADTAKVLFKLKPIHNMKDSSSGPSYRGKRKCF